jgi:pimeloyl-ACP methyl ester carboxylesterase
MDAEGFVLRFSGGKLLDFVDDSDPSVRWDYEIVGPRADWERIWRGDMDLTKAFLPIFGSVVVRGDRVRFAGEIETAAWLTRLMRVAAAQLGWETAPPPPPPEELPGSFAWETEHEVVGRYVTVNGVRTYCEIQGDEGPVTFMALHTAGRDCRQWQQMGDVLAKAGRFIAFDLPGHSKSWPVRTGEGCLTTMDEISAFTWALRSALGITGPTVVLGCSIGGNLVFQLAADYANDVVAMVSMQGAVHSPSMPDTVLALMKHPRVNPGNHHTARTMALTGYRTPREIRRYLQWEAANYSSVSSYADLRAYAKFDFRERAKEIRCPALLIRGTGDWIVSEEMVREAASKLVNAAAVQVEMRPGVGHYAHVEQPVEHGELVLNFLRKHSIVTA